MLPEKLFINLINLDLQERILNCNVFDSNITKALKSLLESDSKTIRSELEDWTLEKVNNKETLFYKGKNYVPQDPSLQKDLIRTFHNHETASHPGELETYNSVRQHYWWPGLQTFVKNYIKGCGVCQQFKIDWNPSKPAFIPTKGVKTTCSFTHCSIDFITDLIPTNGFDSILVIVDQGLTKGIILLPCTKTITTEETAKLLLSSVSKSGFRHFWYISTMTGQNFMIWERTPHYFSFSIHS